MFCQFTATPFLIPISIHYTGGLIARHVLKALFERNSPNNDDDTTDNTEPCTSLVDAVSKAGSHIVRALIPLSYVSVATPHLGIRRATKQNGDWGKNFWASGIDTVATIGMIVVEYF